MQSKHHNYNADKNRSTKKTVVSSDNHLMNTNLPQLCFDSTIKAPASKIYKKNKNEYCKCTIITSSFNDSKVSPVEPQILFLVKVKHQPLLSNLVII